MSAREDLSTRLFEFCNEVGLNEVYGCLESLDGKIRTVTFCKAKVLDGQINIYGLNFIQVKYKTAIRAMPQNDSRIFNKESHVTDFLKAAFVDYDYELANSIPHRNSL